MYGTAEAVIVVALSSSLLFGLDAQYCDPTYGPSGIVECVALSSYTGKQWATCLTDAYIQQKSRYLHECRNRQITYCYYQCMIELYNRTDGFVTSDCSCQQAGVTLPPTAVINPTCYSPPGDSCSWYPDCIEQKISCSGGADGYAIEYAKKLCTGLNEFRSTLSQQVQHWMEAAQTCLQVSLVPSLRPFRNQTCAAVKQLAFASHAGCYFNPYTGAPSYCELTMSDRFQIFWLIKKAFVPDFIESLLGLYKVLKQCAARNAASVLADGKTVLIKMNLRVNNINRLSRSKRSVPDVSVDPDMKLRTESMNGRHRRQILSWPGATEEELLYHRLAGELSAAVASKLQWTENGPLRFTYGQRGENSSVVEAYVLLTDKRSYGLQSLFEDVPAIDMTSLLNSTAEAFQSGTLNGITLQGQHLQLMTLSACLDENCQRASFTVTAPPDLSGSDAIRVSFTVLTALLLLAFHVTMF